MSAPSDEDASTEVQITQILCEPLSTVDFFLQKDQKGSTVIT